MSTNIAMPIPTRHTPSNFHPVSHYPVSTLGNIGNYNLHSPPSMHNIFHHHQMNQNQGSSQISNGNNGSGSNPMFFPPQMNFFPFGFYYWVSKTDNMICFFYDTLNLIFYKYLK